MALVVDSAVVTGGPGAVDDDGVESLNETFLELGLGIKRSIRPSRGRLMYCPVSLNALRPF
jgi:hypothetical protein